MKRITFIIAVYLQLLSAVFSQIVINEVMYAPVSPNKEWFELKNTGTSSVDLQNWKWRDAAAGNALRTISVLNLTILPDSFIVVCEDSVSFRNQYLGFFGKAVQSTGWSALNNSGNENIVIYDASSNHADSLTYNNSWGSGVTGYSLERKQTEISTNLPSNWASSIHPDKSTPGKRNSVTPLLNDLMIFSLESEPAYPFKGGQIEFRLSIRNIGISSANGAEVKIFYDVNNDSINQNSEVICSQNLNILNSGDSILFECTYNLIDTGRKQFIAELYYNSDDDPLNNKFYKKIYVSDQSGSGGGVVINEIMYDPLTGHSEWIELYNGFQMPVNLKKWKYVEFSSSKNLSDSDLVLDPGQYLVIARDSTLFNSFSYLNSISDSYKVIFISSMSLSNSGERILITDSLNNSIDAVSYEASFHNPNLIDTKGISLEKINPAIRSDVNSNWSSSANISGGTPGKINSIYTTGVKSESKVNISPNPFSPDGDGHEDFTVINFNLNVKIAQIRVKIYDIKGRVVRTLMSNSISGNKGEIIFNGLDDNQQKLRTGIYILLIEVIDDKNGTSDNLKVPLVIASKL
ncbi:MAG: lamin tail domain-containing protein [Ignavibacteria bacterium]